MDNSRYQFTNWTDELFEGRFGGNPYLFNPGETKEFDSDKHYMLLILSKQLADRELAKGIKGVLRSKEAGNDYGKAIDANGNLYKPSIEDRKALMVKAIGDLANKPIPYPETQEEEAGATKQATENINELQDQVKSLTDMVRGLVNQIGELKSAPTSTPAQPSTANAEAQSPSADVSGVTSQPKAEAVTEPSSVGMTRDVLYEMATDAGIQVPEGASKEQLIELLGNTRGSAEPLTAMPAAV